MAATGRVLPLGTVFSKPSPYGVVEVRKSVRGHTFLWIDGVTQMMVGGNSEGEAELVQDGMKLCSPDKVFLAGLGAPHNAREILNYPVKHVDCYEINPVVVEAQTYFPAVLIDERYHLHIGDAREALEQVDSEYDCIFIDVEEKTRGHSAWFFTDEGRAAMRKAVKIGGYVCVWDFAGGTITRRMNG